VGGPVLLTTTADSRLTFASDPLRQPDAIDPSPPPMYVTPQNTFGVRIGGATARAEASETTRMDQVLVAGAEAVEFFGLVPDPASEGTVLEFEPGCAAYAPLLSGSTHDADNKPPRFDTLTASGGTTSWARVRGSGTAAATYHAQPR